MMNTLVINKSDQEEDYQNLRWAMEALKSPNKCEHQYQSVLKVEFGLVMATDGFRLHMVTTQTEIADGIYVPTGSKSDIILRRNDAANIPDYNKVFPLEWKPDHVEQYPTIELLIYDVFSFFGRQNLFTIKDLERFYTPDRLISIMKQDRSVILFDGERGAVFMPLSCWS